jgi:hypothetical protein
MFLQLKPTIETLRSRAGQPNDATVRLLVDVA